MAQRDDSVEQWLGNQDSPNIDLMRAARDMILAADDRVTETIKWSTPTFLYKGNILSFTPSKTGVGMMFHRGAEIPGDHPRLEGEGKLVRTMRFSNLDELGEGRRDIEAVVRAWCEWRDGDS
jgi:hypothetical protein